MEAVTDEYWRSFLRSAPAVESTRIIQKELLQECACQTTRVTTVSQTQIRHVLLRCPSEVRCLIPPEVLNTPLAHGFLKNLIDQCAAEAKSTGSDSILEIANIFARRLTSDSTLREKLEDLKIEARQQAESLSQAYAKVLEAATIEPSLEQVRVSEQARRDRTWRDMPQQEVAERLAKGEIIGREEWIPGKSGGDRRLLTPAEWKEHHQFALKLKTEVESLLERLPIDQYGTKTHSAKVGRADDPPGHESSPLESKKPRENHNSGSDQQAMCRSERSFDRSSTGESLKASKDGVPKETVKDGANKGRETDFLSLAAVRSAQGVNLLNWVRVESPDGNREIAQLLQFFRHAQARSSCACKEFRQAQEACEAALKDEPGDEVAALQLINIFIYLGELKPAKDLIVKLNRSPHATSNALIQSRVFFEKIRGIVSKADAVASRIVPKATGSGVFRSERKPVDQVRASSKPAVPSIVSPSATCFSRRQLLRDLFGIDDGDKHVLSDTRRDTSMLPIADLEKLVDQTLLSLTDETAEQELQRLRHLADYEECRILIRCRNALPALLAEVLQSSEPLQKQASLEAKYKIRRKFAADSPQIRLRFAADSPQIRFLASDIWQELWRKHLIPLNQN